MTEKETIDGQVPVFFTGKKDPVALRSPNIRCLPR